MVKIFAESTCDLSPELVKKYDITIIPLHIILDDEEFEDGININPDQIFAWSDLHSRTPKTSAPSIETAIQRMKPFLDQGDEIICFSISESMSTSGNIIRIAAEELKKEDQVTVINSMNLSTGIGLLVIEASILAREGLSRSEIISRIQEMIPRVRASFVLDTMTFLRRGGRCSAITAIAGSVLKIHPEIVVEDGAMNVGRKYRGNLDRVIVKYAKDLEPLLLQGKKDRVFITHSGCRKEIIDSVRGYLVSLNHFDEILETRAGSVISSHCGPGTLGILFIQE